MPFRRFLEWCFLVRAVDLRAVGYSVLACCSNPFKNWCGGEPRNGLLRRFAAVGGPVAVVLRRGVRYNSTGYERRSAMTNPNRALAHAKRAIRQFIRANWSDQKLSEVYAFNQ